MRGAVGILLIVVGSVLIYLAVTGNLAIFLAAATAPNLVVVQNNKETPPSQPLNPLLYGISQL